MSHIVEQKTIIADPYLRTQNPFLLMHEDWSAASTIVCCRITLPNFAFKCFRESSRKFVVMTIKTQRVENIFRGRFSTAVVNFNSFHFSFSIRPFWVYLLLHEFLDKCVCAWHGMMIFRGRKHNGRGWKLNYKQSVITKFGHFRAHR